MIVKLFWGALHKPISEQLREQGVELDEKKLRKYDKWKNSIGFLYLTNVVTESENTKIIKKAHSLVIKDVEQEVRNENTKSNS